jgi:hypothetical protein
MYKNIVKYLEGINFSQLTLAEKTQINNLYRATPDLVISQSSLSRIQTYVRKVNPAYTLNISGWVSLLKETLY